MDQLLRNRMWGFVVGVLVFANMATLAGFWYIKLHTNDNKTAALPPGQANTKNFIIKQLQFDESQQQAYTELVRQHRENVSAVQQQLHQAKNAFFDSISNPETTQAQVDSLSARIAGCERKLDIITYEHFKKIRALCNDQQKAKFDNIIKQALQMMGPAGGRPQGPPPQGQGGNFPPPPDDGQGPPPQGPPQ